jgi:hypothetical protein
MGMPSAASEGRLDTFGGEQSGDAPGIAANGVDPVQSENEDRLDTASDLSPSEAWLTT